MCELTVRGLSTVGVEGVEERDLEVLGGRPATGWERQSMFERFACLPPCAASRIQGKPSLSSSISPCPTMDVPEEARGWGLDTSRLPSSRRRLSVLSFALNGRAGEGFDPEPLHALSFLALGSMPNAKGRKAGAVPPRRERTRIKETTPAGQISLPYQP